MYVKWGYSRMKFIYSNHFGAEVSTKYADIIFNTFADLAVILARVYI